MMLIIFKNWRTSCPCQPQLRIYWLFFEIQTILQKNSAVF